MSATDSVQKISITKSMNFVFAQHKSDKTELEEKNPDVTVFVKKQSSLH